MATLSTSIIGFKRKRLVAFGADSRVTNHHYGNVMSNDELKIHRVCDNVLGTGAGKGEIIKSVFKKARIHYLTNRSPNSVREAAQLVADRANHSTIEGSQPDLVVAGWISGDCEMYKLTPKQTESASVPPTVALGPHTNTRRSDALPAQKVVYEVTAVDEVIEGKGARFMKPFLKGVDYHKYPLDASATFEQTRDVMKDAMFHAKKYDYCTDGKFRVVCVFENGKVRCSTATPTGPQPLAPYGDWTEEDFSPEADVTDDEKKKRKSSHSDAILKI